MHPQPGEKPPEDRVAVIIPAFNEAEAIGKVIAEIPRALADQIIVVDNGSTDGTAAQARRFGAAVVSEPRRGYGSACLAGIAALAPCDIVVFLDGDHSDFPEEMALLVEPISRGMADLVIGSRLLGNREPRALLPHAIWGNRVASFLLRRFFGQHTTDLGPFRAIRRDALDRLRMQDRGFGWTVEMQAKAARRGLRVEEVPVRYRRRIGRSKISGSMLASVRAAVTILAVLLKVYSERMERQ